VITLLDSQFKSLKIIGFGGRIGNFYATGQNGYDHDYGVTFNDWWTIKSNEGISILS
jgi:hypothetical protein